MTTESKNSADAEAEASPTAQKSGEILFCGGTNWDAMGRRKEASAANLVSPTRLRPLLGVNICFIASGCVSCHCVALDTNGRCYTWGRNEKGQLGHGDIIQRDRPTVVSELSKHKIVKAGTGRSHTVVVTEDGESFAFGWNKHGQLGSGSIKNEIETSPVRCLVSQVTAAVCGGDFTVWLSSVQGSTILTAGLPQYGQLGHGTDNEYNMKDSSVRLAYEPQPRPRAIASLAEKTVVKVACGTNHTVAADSNGYVYTWGFGGYGRLGHRETKDECVPRIVETFQRNNILPPTAIVSAGSLNSACTAGGGQLYMWGKLKNTGDEWMYPKPLMDLSGWNIRCMDSGNLHHFVGADDSCISWGHAQSGELGYGPIGQKSSTNPKKVDILEGMRVLSVACGMAHSLIIVDREKVADRLNELAVYDGEIPIEGGGEEFESKDTPKRKPSKNAVVNSSGKSRKRNKTKDESDSEDDVSDNDSGGAKNGIGNKKAKKTQRGDKSSGRGRGKTTSKASEEGKKSVSRGLGRGKTAKRGRPRK